MIQGLNGLTGKLARKAWGLVAATVLAVAAAACGNADKLSDEIVGTWEAAPEQLNIVGAESATLTRIMEFAGRDDSPEGTVTLTGLITVANSMNVDTPAEELTDTAAATSCVNITASGAFSISGAFQAMNGHEIDLRLDPSSLTVAVDPDAVEILLNHAGSQTDPQAVSSVQERLRPNATALVRQQITRAAKRLLFDLDEIDGIIINGQILTCEVKQADLTFRRHSD